MNVSKDIRNQHIKQMRAEGHSYSEIAKVFNISNTRVQQICAKDEERINELYRSPLGMIFNDVTKINTRILKQLKFRGVTDVRGAIEYLRSGRHYRNLGAKSNEILADTIEKAGFNW